MIRNRKLLLSVFGVSLLILGACEGGSDNLNVVQDPGAQPGTTVQDQFGAGFAAAFNADPNSEPVDTDNIVITFRGVDGPNFTEDPIDF